MAVAMVANRTRCDSSKRLLIEYQRIETIRSERGDRQKSPRLYYLTLAPS